MKLANLFKALCTSVMQKGLLIIFGLTLGVTLFGQGVTTSSMNGRVTDDKGEALIGANVIATHVPSGTTYGNATDLDGYYRIPGMRVGGPYKIVISYTGFEDQVKEGIYLTLGQSFKYDGGLKEAAVAIDVITVAASRNDVFDGNRTGQQTIIDENTINAIPTVSRSIADFARLNPLASIDEGADGFSISIAGQNNRYNAIYIDGAVNNDVFGLAGSGTNGGQTGAGPVSIDAIEQFQVSVAPFDVRQSGFAGGAVSAVTRSGTNNFEGSAYYFLRNETLAGKTPVYGDGVTRRRLPDFSAKTYGARLGGPIIKNKLFFFANVEIQDDVIPEPFDFNNYTGASNRRSAIDSLLTKLDSYGYNPGTFENNATSIERTFVLGKLDWNINQSNKLTLRHSVNSIDNLEARNSTTTFLGFENGSEYFPSVTNSTALELNTLFGSKASNNLTIGFTSVRDDRDAFGDPFPTVVINDGAGRSMQFGAEPFSTANRLDQDVLTITDNFSIYKGKHTITLGTHNEYYKVANLFIRQNYGQYTFASLSDFLNDRAPIRFDRSYSQVDNVTGDDSKAIAAFKGFQFGLYAQDEIQLSNKLKVTIGLRADMPVFPDDVPVNQNFNENTIPKIEALYGADALKGAVTGEFIDPQLMISPRLGFNYDFTGEQKTQLRGGLGIFNSRLPLVWPGGSYNNFGFNVSGVSYTTPAAIGSIRFNPDVNNQPPGSIDLNNPRPGGQIDLFAKNFKIPQIFRSNLALDKKLGGFVVTVEGLYSKTLNNVFYQNLNLRPSTATLSGTGDTRPTFNQGSRIEPTYTGIFLASNTNKGYTYNLALTLTRPITKGVGGTIGYSYGDSYSLNDGTSSQNNSQWQGYKNIQGLNYQGNAQRSNFASGHRLFAQLSIRKELFKTLGAQLSIFYNGQQGQPYSYTYADFGSGNASSSLVNDGAFANNNLIYVPRDQNDIKLLPLTASGVTYTADQQWQILNSFIENDKSLSEARGTYIERNSVFNPWSHIVDLKGIVDIYNGFSEGKLKHSLQLTVDVFNFTNMLGGIFEKDWGKIYFADNFDNFTLLSYAGVVTGTTTPQYRLNPVIAQGKKPWDNRFDDSGIRSSRWQMQVGLRYSFK